jgi:FAD/FMN-containing dehydrogenase
VFGRAQAPDGVVIDMRCLKRILDVSRDRIVVQAGATRSEVLDTTLPRGLVPLVLTDYLHLTVGGTLAVGGIGARTARHGAQADTVIELDVVTGTVRLVTCSPTRDTDLFHAVLAGLGQMGVITRAALQLDTLEKALRGNGQWLLAHPWLATFVADSAVESVVERELAELTPDDLGPFGQVALSAVPGRSVRTPLLRMPSDDLCYALTLIRIPATAAAADADADAGRLVAANRTVYERVRTAGGTLYPVSALTMSQDDWRAHFGPQFPLLDGARQESDPGGVLTPRLRDLLISGEVSA